MKDVQQLLQVVHAVVAAGDDVAVVGLVVVASFRVVFGLAPAGSLPFAALSHDAFDEVNMRMTCLAHIQRLCLQCGQVRVRMQQRPYCLPGIYRVGNDLTFIA